MKLAVHFNGVHPELGISYGLAAQRLVFPALLGLRNVHVVSKIFVGDLLFSNVDMPLDGRPRSFSRANHSLSDILECWQDPPNPVWNRFSEERLSAALGAIYAICFESIEQETVERLHESLIDSASYLGAMEVDDGSFVHWQLYSQKLIPLLRVHGRAAHVFWDGISEDGKNQGFFEDARGLGFDRLSWESLNSRFSIFDRYHNFDHAKRVAEWKRDCGQLLGFIADSIVSRLGDVVPELGDRLWSALQTFDQAETTEQLSQVAATCRRIIEHVADQLFPPQETVGDGPKLGPKHYRNRLLAFADQAQRADTTINLVSVSTATLDEQITKLLAVAQKGIHAEIYRTETRRCLLRTILLLDDLVALKQEPLQTMPDLDFGPVLPTRC